MWVMWKGAGVAGRDRVAGVRRARERQSRIEAATVGVARAQARLERQQAARERARAEADSRVAGAEDALTREIGVLVDACGSTAYAAEILGMEERDVRKAVTRASGVKRGSSVEHSDTGAVTQEV